MQKNYSFSYSEFTHYSELEPAFIQLVEAAKQATEKAYAPYSHFHVGAAVLTSDDQIITGSNQENASFSLTICAERTALGAFSAITNNDTEIKAMAITYNAQDVALDKILAPCGACRQHILEYQSRQSNNFPIIFTAINGGTIIVDHIEALLPFAFTNQSLPQNTK